MSSQAWSWLNPRAMAPQADRLTETRGYRRQRPATKEERALDLFMKGRTAALRSSGEGGGALLTADDVRHALGGLAPRPFRFGMAAFLGDGQSLRIVEGFLVQELRWSADAGGWIETEADAHRVERLASLMLFEVISARSRHETWAHEERLPEGSAAVKCPQCNGLGHYRDAWDVAKWSRYQRWVRRARLRNPHERPDKQDPKSEWAKRRALHDALIAEAQLEEADAAARPCELCGGTGRYLFTVTERARAIGVSRRTWYRHWDDRYAEAIEIPRRWEASAVSHVRRRLSRGP